METRGSQVGLRQKDTKKIKKKRKVRLYVEIYSDLCSRF